MKRLLPLITGLAGACATERSTGVWGQQAGEVQLRCAPADADVLLDGFAQGTCEGMAGQRIKVARGQHRLEVKKQGFSPWVRWLDADVTRVVLNVALVAEGERSP